MHKRHKETLHQRGQTMVNKHLSLELQEEVCTGHWNGLRIRQVHKKKTVKFHQA